MSGPTGFHPENELILPLQWRQTRSFFRCGLLCRSTYELNAHIYNVHLRNQRAGYRCRYCADVIVNGESDIRKHLSEVHSINAEFTLHYVNTYLQDEDNHLRFEFDGARGGDDTACPEEEEEEEEGGGGGATSGNSLLEPEESCCHCSSTFDNAHNLVKHLRGIAGIKLLCPM